MFALKLGARKRTFHHQTFSHTNKSGRARKLWNSTHSRVQTSARSLHHTLVDVDCEIYGAKRTETFSKCDWNVFYEPLTASMGSNVNPFSPLNFLCALNGDKLGFYCVWGCWLCFDYNNGKATSSLSKLKIVIQTMFRVRGSRRCQRRRWGRSKKKTRAWTSLFLIKTKPAAPALNRSTNWTSPIIGDDRQATLIHRLVEQKSISFDYLNFFPSTWRAIYFTPFGNYSIERQALLVRPFVWWRVAEKSLERSHLMVDWILLR